MSYLKHGVCAVLFSVLTAGPAQAILLEAGKVETSGANSAIDLWYFTLDFDFFTRIQVDPLSVGPPLTTENSSVILYENDGAGGIGTLLASNGSPAPSNAFVALNLLAGDYVVALSAFDLLSSEVGGAFQTDSTVALDIDYEIVLSDAGGNDSRFTCSIFGNLDGSFTRTDKTFDSSANCAVPAAQVSEAPSIALLGFGVIALACHRRRSLLG